MTDIRNNAETTTKFEDQPLELTSKLTTENDHSTPFVMECCPCSGPTPTISNMMLLQTMDENLANPIDLSTTVKAETADDDSHNLMSTINDSDNLMSTTELQSSETLQMTEETETTMTETVPTTETLPTTLELDGLLMFFISINDFNVLSMF